MPIRSSNGFVDVVSHDVKGFALSRWLLEHAEDRDNATFREQKRRLEILRVAKYTRGILEENIKLEQEAEENKPALETGKKSYKNVKKAQEVANGTPAEREKKKAKIIAMVSALRDSNKCLSWSDACKKVAENCTKNGESISDRTVRRLTKEIQWKL